jgi:hypothetical protein
MWLFLVMLVGVIGTIFIERLHRNSDGEAIRVPVQIDKYKANRSYRK